MLGHRIVFEHNIPKRCCFLCWKYLPWENLLVKENLTRRVKIPEQYGGTSRVSYAI